MFPVVEAKTSQTPYHEGSAQLRNCARPFQSSQNQRAVVRVFASLRGGTVPNRLLAMLAIMRFYCKSMMR